MDTVDKQFPDVMFSQYISPTFKSTPLFKPDEPPINNFINLNPKGNFYSEQYGGHQGYFQHNDIPKQGRHSLPNIESMANCMIFIPAVATNVDSTTSLDNYNPKHLEIEDPEPPYKHLSRSQAWGTHIHKYAGIGDLPFLGFKPKVRDLYVSRSHRHYLSGLSHTRHSSVTRSHITPFKKSLNRANDDLVPPANLIPIYKYGRLIEQSKFVKEDKYASHKNRTELFPPQSTQKLSQQTEDAIKALLAKRYGQTTYTENFPNQRDNTTLKLGPLFQFYDNPVVGLNIHDEDPGLETDLEVKFSETTVGGLDEESDEETEESETKSGQVSNKTSSTSINETIPISNKSSKISLTPKNSALNLPTLNDAMWPAWPGNRVNNIDPVTLKITEKKDVCCLEDKYDVKELPPFPENAHIMDYKIPNKLDPAPTSAYEKNEFQNKFAPGSIDFAYSGYQGQFGSKFERNNNLEVIDIKDYALLSKHSQLPKHLQENVNRQRLCNKVALDAIPPQQPKLLTKRPKTVAPTAPTKQDHLNDLKNTIENLKTPMKRSVTLPPLWETLDYSSNRVVDTLGVQFKTAAQQRYHQQHQDTSHNLYTSWPAETFIHHNDRRQTFRRQYYNGHHMGSSFR